MRKLFMAIFIPILVLLGTPALLAAIMYDAAGYDEMPTDLYTADANAMEMLNQELSDSLDELATGVNDDFEFNLNEDIINVAIYEQLREINPQYAPGENCETPDECYFKYVDLPIEEGSQLRLVGAWVEFEQNKIIMNVFIDVQITESISYKTVIETHFNIQDHPDANKYTFQFEKINIGNLPIPSSLMSSILNLVQNNFEGVDLEAGLEDLPIGEFDIDTFTLTIEKQEIVDKIGETEDGEEPDDTTLMLQEIVSIIFEQRLLEFELVDEELILAARISKFESEDVVSIPDYLYEMHQVTYNEFNEPVYGDFDATTFNPEEYLQNVFTEFVFNNALVGGGFRITDELFNKIIYHTAGGFEDMTQVQELTLLDGTVREIEVGLQAVWFEIEEDGIYANALFKLDTTMSLMRLKAVKVEEASSDTELVFDFQELTFGEDQGETASDYVAVTNLEVFESYLVGLDDIKFGSITEDPNGGVFLTISSDALTSVLTEGTEEAVVNITGITLVHGAIEMGVEAADPQLQAVLDGISTAIEDVLGNETFLTDLETALDAANNPEAQDVINAVQNIQTTLNDPEGELDPEDVEALFDEFDDLTTEEQEEFLNEVVDALPEDVYNDFVAMFGGEALPDLDEVPAP